MNKILEAILKGIQIGLEIQDDKLDLPVFLKSEITTDYHTDRADQIKWIRENFVDLGLPSGTLWCKYNLGATCGNKANSWYGDYYAWGEVETKKSYEWKTYKYWDGSQSSLTKYNDEDNKVILDPEDDVIRATLGKDFSLPTAKNFEELCALPNEWVENYNGVKSLNGRVFTGKNGNILFIPASGFRFGSSLYGVRFECDLWPSSLNFLNATDACYLYFCSNDIDPFYAGNRCYGFPARGILQK